MQIRSARLRNIKSFGEGPDGAGLRLNFEGGLNRIAGCNGAGKSTVIEALGYALFDAPPELGARMDLDTALLRSGAGEGEIEFEIASEGAGFRVRRGVGKKSKLRWTVSDENGFIIHDDPGDVRRFLATAAGLNAPEGLPDLFRKLVGVRQGRLLDPFELTPGEARKHFSPILNVEIYQQCFDRLKDPADALKEAIHLAEKQIEHARGIADSLSGAEQEIAQLSARLEAAAPQLAAHKETLRKAETLLGSWTAKERAIGEAENAHKAACKDVEVLDQRLFERRTLLKRAEEAQKVRETHAQDHETYLKAQDDLASIAARREEMQEARKRVEGIKKQLAEQDTVASEAQTRARELNEELEARLKGHKVKAAALGERRAKFDGAVLKADRPRGEQLRELDDALGEVQRWSAVLNNAARGVRQAGEKAVEADQALARFDPARVQAGEDALASAREQHDAARLIFNEMETRKRARMEMAENLAQSGQCPLLAERCRQFDRGKLVLSEVQLDEELEKARAYLAGADAARRQAEDALADAHAEQKETEGIRRNAGNALEEIAKSRTLALDEKPRAAHEQLAQAFPLADGRAALPEVRALPNPGVDPWQALGAAPEVAGDFVRFATGVGEAAESWKARLERERETSDTVRRQRDLEAQGLEQEAERLRESEVELARLRRKLDDENAKTQTAHAEAEALANSLKEVEAQGGDFARLETIAREAERAQQRCAEGHRKFLTAEADAGRLGPARAEVAMALGALDAARKAAEQALAARKASVAAYDPAAHDQARGTLHKATAQVAALEKDMERDRAQLDDATRRAQRREEALQKLRTHEDRRVLLEARRALLEHARRVLRDAGPRVAAHLVDAVNGRAQKIYTALSPHDPGQLAWQPDYELQVATSNGQRRFATLSGGQKVKAALALQLALVQQFSRAGLCIFDEPTSALDAESRALLAEATLEAQRVAGFQQMFVVSHDDAFDGCIEHTVHLNYSPAQGTAVAS